MKKIVLYRRLSCLLCTLLLSSCDIVPKPSGTLPSVTPPISQSASGGDGRLVVYSVNDTHGSIEDDPNAYIAGLAKLRSFIYSDPDYDPIHSVILSAGDMFQGSGLSNMTKGRAMTSVMNTFPFDAMAIGNHEFDWGLEELIDGLDGLNEFPFLAANIARRDGKEISGVAPSVMVDRGGFKVGIIGTIQHGIDSSIAYNKVSDYDISDEVSTVVSTAQKMKDEGADLVINLTHQGFTENVKTIGSSGVVDAVILGHTHALIDHTTTIENHTVPFLEASSNARAYSKIIFDHDGYVSHKVVQVESYEIEATEVAPDLAAIIKSYKDEVAPVLNEVIATTDGSFYRYSDGDNTIGSLPQLITKSMYEYGKKKGLTDLVAVHNFGGIRKDFTCDSAPCQITYGDLYEISPFDNEVKYVQIKGSKLASSIKSHAYYGYDIRSDALLDGTPIQYNKDYNIITIDYLTTTPDYPLYAENGGQYPGAELIYIRDLLKAELKSVGTIRRADYPFN